MSDYLSVRDVAKKLGKDPASIRQWVKSGELRAVNRGSAKRVRLGIKPEWIELWEREKSVQADVPVPRSRKRVSTATKYY